MTSNTGYIIAGVAAAAVVGVVGYVIWKNSQSSGGGGGGVTCPTGDIALDSSGACPPNYIKDPNNFGCCMPLTGGGGICPPGDVSMINGQCPPNPNVVTKYVPDPNNPGCCKRVIGIIA